MKDPITWARSSIESTFCAVAHIDRQRGEVICYCKHRWSTRETVELYDEPKPAERCERCCGCLVALGVDA